MRYEYKYIVPTFRLSQLRSMIIPFVEYDSFAKQNGGEYTVKSIYYDTPKLEMYHSKIDHLANRLKVRVRGYNDFSEDAIVFLEIKRKYEGPIVKNRAKVHFSDLLNYIDQKDYAVFSNVNYRENIKRFIFQVYSNNLQPLVNVIYEREAFHSKIKDLQNDCRITLDKNIRSVFLPQVENLFDDSNSTFVNPDFSVLEVKFNQYCPIWMKAILMEMELVKEPASKYVMCIENHHIPNAQKRFFNFHP